MRCIFILLFLLPSVTALTLGVSPPRVDLGEMDRGAESTVELTIFNPNTVATSFIFEEDECFEPTKKTVRIKGKGMSKAGFNVKAIDETCPITIRPKTSDGSLVPGITVEVNTRLAQEVGQKALAAVVQPKPQAIMTENPGEIILTDDKPMAKPNRFVGAAIVASIILLGMVVFKVVKRD
ncbi:MAG: hypothetical protein KJ709_08640 [Nanoarchaeota archaeon]|nr:hypothetical protein [Nanoarchaeota archaeon]